MLFRCEVAHPFLKVIHSGIHLERFHPPVHRLNGRTELACNRIEFRFAGCHTLPIGEGQRCQRVGGSTYLLFHGLEFPVFRHAGIVSIHHVRHQAVGLRLPADFRSVTGMLIRIFTGGQRKHSDQY